MNTQQHAEELLSNHGLKKTPIRIAMLKFFMEHQFALSASYIESNMKAMSDRVTIYRALSSFEEKGILHKAPDDGYGVKYALCSEHCPDNAHEDHHVHFICQECSNTYCLEDVHIPMVKLPEDYAIESFTYTINGVCKACKR